jgi:hypothetical protein
VAAPPRDMHALVLREALDELARLEKKYERVSPLAAVWQAVHEAEVAEAERNGDLETVQKA